MCCEVDKREPSRKWTQVVEITWFLTDKNWFEAVCTQKGIIAWTCEIQAITSWDFKAESCHFDFCIEIL